MTTWASANLPTNSVAILNYINNNNSKTDVKNNNNIDLINNNEGSINIDLKLPNDHNYADDMSFSKRAD